MERGWKFLCSSSIIAKENAKINHIRYPVAIDVAAVIYFVMCQEYCQVNEVNIVISIEIPWWV